MRPAELLSRARLYFVVEAVPDELVRAALRGGVDMLQLRAKDASDDEILAAAARFRALCDEHGALFWLNDRPDLALVDRADGVHVGQDDLPVAAVRRFGLPVGLSTHAPEELARAESDYVGVGPVFATPTKEGRPAVGLDYVRHAAAHARVPWFAIGGIDETNVSDAVSAGATRIAVVRAIGEAADPERTARALRRALGD